MFIYRLTEPIDVFDGLTPLPDWLNGASPHATQWALQAVLALADAAPNIGWHGDMRHLPSVGVIPDPPAVTAYLVVKQDDNGTTFIVTASDTTWLDSHAAASAHVDPRAIGTWTHPTFDDINIPNAPQTRQDP
ncbi:hypothetical protein EDC02_0897 [Micromonospora sp. Llam0]|uniref:hypothetical protein n=1 Tax=Micromonospora sp. Llam0 TaxID=2485143 RepID=UPI000F491B20|nr:hypothetical protein [Micromonospora sp. Llam0]ROO59110.1 hypothetical protein EDC02_0897 [Micromonospora sp. Llam0]